eukprot:4600645-Pleurochrysis_carterae.AAC.3
MCYLSQNKRCAEWDRGLAERVMKIALVVRARRQNAFTWGSALSFAPLQAQLNRKSVRERTRTRLLSCVPTSQKRCERDA